MAAVFVLFASVTGVLVAFAEFFGEDEAQREALRELVSPVTTSGPPAGWEEPLRKAVARAAAEAPGAPIDEIRLGFKGEAPTVSVFLGRPGGGEDRRLVVDAKTGALRSVESYVDKPLLHRIHSGEAFGDGGLVVAMIWGAAMAVLSASGLIIYFAMQRKTATGLKRWFW